MAADTNPVLGVTVGDDGITFGLWAPFATAVWVTGDFNNWDEAATPLTADKKGNWWVTAAGARPGQEYKYVIQNGDKRMLRNDPRALQLTATGESSVIVGQDFAWQDDNFQMTPLHEQVIYELHIGTFNRHEPETPGTFDTAIEKLDYLVGLGVTTVELMPCSGVWMDRWWGYTPEYLYAVDAAYGGRRGLMRFVQAAHQRGLGVLLDVVYNHLDSDPKLDLWQFDGWSQDDRGGMYFYNDWRAETPWGNTRLDYGRPEVRDYITGNVKMWMQDFHIDGLRVDSTHYIRNAMGRDNDASTDIADGWQVLQNITNTARAVNPQALLIAEDTASNAFITKPTSAGGAGFGAQWETPFPYVLRNVLNPLEDYGRNLDELQTALGKTYNNDPFQRVIYSESHDADANGRARLDEEIAPGNAASVFARRRSALAIAIVLTVPGIPMLFQGQEFMEDGSFNHWDPLDWSKAATFHGMLQLHKDLIALRRNKTGASKGLGGPHLAVTHFDEAGKVLAYHRKDAGGAGDDVVVVVNFANQTRNDYVLPFPNTGTWKIRLNSDWQGYSPDFTNTQTPDVAVETDHGAINIGPYSVLILSQDQPNQT